ncbi:FkbM family methyltransferase [Fluviicola sp.]|uniref:FkbM family methyltransferase n=1 Tax=Fluviicola sp. TaxID=1917219 RepID=UPI002633BF66|nr:FkbM family methyltransferase [Fluviicola sp.]
MSAKDTFRALFKVPLVEKLLASYTNNKAYGSGLTKLTPNHYSYKSPALRRVKRNEVNFELDIANIVDWNIYFGFYEASRENLFHLHPNPNVILDIGANIGEISLRFAQRYPQASIHGFEPFPDTFETLKRNVSLNSFPNIELHPLGLGSEQGKVFFEERSAGNPGMNRVTSDPEKSSREVAITTLDSFIQNLGDQHISLIKIDVEGYELEVLKGARNLIQEHHPVFFIELDDDNLKDQNSSALELIQFLQAFGYKIRHAETHAQLTENSDFHDCHFDIVAEV